MKKRIYILFGLVYHFIQTGKGELLIMGSRRSEITNMPTNAVEDFETELDFFFKEFDADNEEEV